MKATFTLLLAITLAIDPAMASSGIALLPFKNRAFSSQELYQHQAIIPGVVNFPFHSFVPSKTQFFAQQIDAYFIRGGAGGYSQDHRRLLGSITHRVPIGTPLPAFSAFVLDQLLEAPGPFSIRGIQSLLDIDDVMAARIAGAMNDVKNLHPIIDLNNITEETREKVMLALYCMDPAFFPENISEIGGGFPWLATKIMKYRTRKMAAESALKDNLIVISAEKFAQALHEAGVRDYDDLTVIDLGKPFYPIIATLALIGMSLYHSYASHGISPKPGRLWLQILWSALSLAVSMAVSGKSKRSPKWKDLAPGVHRRVLQILESRGWTPHHVASRAQVTRPETLYLTLLKILGEKGDPSLPAMIEIAELLQTNVGWLVNEEGSPEPVEREESTLSRLQQNFASGQLTENSLQKKTGFDSFTLQSIFKGYYSSASYGPRMGTVVRLAEAYGEPVGHFANGELTHVTRQLSPLPNVPGSATLLENYPYFAYVELNDAARRYLRRGGIKHTSVYTSEPTIKDLLIKGMGLEVADLSGVAILLNGAPARLDTPIESRKANAIRLTVPAVPVNRDEIAELGRRAA
jgi:hypothetical protein